MINDVNVTMDYKTQKICLLHSRLTCMAACLCDSAIESRAQQPVCRLQAKKRRKSLGGGNAATLNDLMGHYRRKKTKHKNINNGKKTLFFIKTFGAVSHLFQTI